MAPKRVTRRVFLKTGAASALVAGFPAALGAEGGGVPLPPLAPGTWAELSKTALRPTVPTTIGGIPLDDYGGNGYKAENVMRAWNGGAWAEEIETLFVHGGGHADSPISNIFAFPMSSLAWRVESPQASAYNINDPLMGHNGLDTNPDGTPCSVHSTGLMAYVPQPINAFWRCGGSRWSKSGSGTGATWLWSLSNKAWSRLAYVPENQFAPALCWHPKLRGILVQLLTRLWLMDPVGNTWRPLTAPARTWFSRGWAVFDSLRNRALFFNTRDWPGQVSVIDLSGGPSGLAVGQASSLHTMTGAVPPEWKGPEVWWAQRINGFYDDLRDAVVHWGGNRNIYSMNATFNWTLSVGTGVDPGDGVTSQFTGRSIEGHYHRFFRMRARDLYGLVTSIDQNIQIYRPLDVGAKTLRAPGVLTVSVLS